MNADGMLSHAISLRLWFYSRCRWIKAQNRMTERTCNCWLAMLKHPLTHNKMYDTKTASEKKKIAWLQCKLLAPYLPLITLSLFENCGSFCKSHKKVATSSDFQQLQISLFNRAFGYWFKRVVCKHLVCVNWQVWTESVNSYKFFIFGCLFLRHQIENLYNWQKILC